MSLEINFTGWDFVLASACLNQWGFWSSAAFYALYIERLLTDGRRLQ